MIREEERKEDKDTYKHKTKYGGNIHDNHMELQSSFFCWLCGYSYIYLYTYNCLSPLSILYSLCLKQAPQLAMVLYLVG